MDKEPQVAVNTSKVKLTAIVLAASLPFLFTLQGDFVFDDSEAIVKNEDVYSESWIQPFYNDFWGTRINHKNSHKSYRPLTILTFRLNYIINNKILSATQFKITNLICHVINSVLVWKTYELIMKDFGIKTDEVWHKNISLLAALLFAVHPIHVEAVCGIVGRADILASITFFLGFLAYRKAMDAWEDVEMRAAISYLVFSVIMAGASLLFKENGITVGGFCICYELVIWLQQKYSAPESKSINIKTVYKNTHTSLQKFRICFYIITITLIIYGRWRVMGSTKPVFMAIDNPAAFSDNLLTKTLTYNYLYFVNFLLFVWPQWLCYDWSMGCVPLLEYLYDFRVLFVLLLYAYGMALLKTAYVKRNVGHGGFILVAGLLMVIPFLPAANVLYPVGFVIAERILYIPSAGYCLLVALGCTRFRGVFNKIVTKAFLILLVIYAARSYHRSMDWQNEPQLFAKGYHVCPLNAKVRYNIAKAIDDRMKNDTFAIQEYREAIRLNPTYYQAMNNLANLLRHTEQYAEAEQHLVNAIRLKYDFPAAWMNLGILLVQLKRFEEADTAYQTALKYRRKYSECYFNIGNMYLQMQRTQDAIDNWFLAINYSKHDFPQAWNNLLTLLDRTEQWDKAQELIPEALKRMPKKPPIVHLCASILAKLQRYDEAEHLFIRSIQLYGDKVQAEHYYNLGVMYHRWRKYDKAKIMYHQAKHIDPNHENAKKNFEIVKEKLSRNNVEMNAPV